MERCSNPNHRDFRLYGGRGIKVCDRWQSFACFLEDMGERPPGKTIERVDSDKDYELDNCIWADHTSQANNTNRNHFLTFNGKTLTVSQWAREPEIKQLGITKAVIHRRFALGWSVEQCLTEPLREVTQSIEFAGFNWTVKEWGKKIGVSPGTLSKRITSGWDAKRALTTPLKGKKPNKFMLSLLQNQQSS